MDNNDFLNQTIKDASKLKVALREIIRFSYSWTFFTANLLN